MTPLEAGGFALLAFFALVRLRGFRSRDWKFLIFLFGAYVFCDGLGSILMYLDQSWVEHLPRVMRMIVGSCLMVLERFK